MAPTIITKALTAPAAQFPGGDAFDLCSLDDVKLELNLTTGASDAWLKKIITRVSDSARRYCNRILQPQLWLDEIWEQADPYPWQVPPRLMPLQLSQFPILSTPSPAGTAPPLAPVLSAASGGALPAQGYYVRITYVAPNGETAASQESFQACAAGQLLKVAAPVADSAAIATGWNVYVSNKSFAETQQNGAPIGMGNSWTEPASGLVTGNAPPPYALVVENAPLVPTPLCEGVDFLVDAEHGQLTRLFLTTGAPRSWSLPVVAIYTAPYAEVPDIVQDAAILLVKARYFSRLRDPAVRSQDASGILAQQYVMGTGPGGADDMSAEATAKLDRFRVPVIA